MWSSSSHFVPSGFFRLAESIAIDVQFSTCEVVNGIKDANAEVNDRITVGSREYLINIRYGKEHVLVSPILNALSAIVL
jgi:hypothetical protein